MTELIIVMGRAAVCSGAGYLAKKAFRKIFL